ncbi:hypothetical protein C8Q80DRAFT_1232843 [Daedaleopsis nitida]|nr:hypothetical protein C8Q80DRAFT_1232843 [Daedaleopsis nitida]
MSSGSTAPALPPAPPLPPNIALLAGPQLLGYMFAWGLQGVLSVQCYIYYLYFPKDHLALKALVWGVFIWEWVQMGLVTQTAFDIDVYHYGDIGSLTAFHSTWFSVPVMSAVVSFVVQCYFAWRIWVLSRSRILVGAILFLSFAQMVLGIAGGVTLAIIDANAVEASVNRPIVASGLIIATVVDVMIAIAMTFLLLRAKSGIKQSDDIVNRLVRLIIETGALTASVALLYVVVFMVDTQDLLFECPALILPKLYSNTLIVSLNNRAFVRGAISKTLTETSSGSRGTVPSAISRTLVREDGRPPLRGERMHGVQIDVLEERYVELTPMEMHRGRYGDDKV